MSSNRTRTILVAGITISRLSNTLLDLRYSYDNVGNILSIYNSTSTESYTFDALNRLKSTTGTWGTLKYGYNATGDRLWMWNSNGSTNTTYSYGATSTSFNRLYSAGSTSYTYDNNGNIKTETTGSVTKYYSYDFENRLTKVTQGSSTLGSYGYSPNGVRVLSIESGSSTVSLSMGVNVIYEKTIGQSSSNDYVFADGLLIVKLSGGTVYYYHQDHLGNTRLVTVGSQIQYSSSYQPYGPAYHPSGTDPVYKYTRKPQSPATGLYYYGARWYNTTLGRFLTRDPFRGRATEPQTCSRFTLPVRTGSWRRLSRSAGDRYSQGVAGVRQQRAQSVPIHGD